MENFKTYTEFHELNEKVKSWNDVAKIMDKALKLADVPLSYAKDYVKSLERMAKKNSKKFFAEYGNFSEDDFIEDVEYNMANESKDFKPHMMYDPETGEEYKAEKPEDHDRMSKLGYVHEKPKSVDEAYTDEERMELADKGFALSDGSYPIKDLKDLKNAIMAYGRAKDQARTAKFIAKRAKALGAEDLVPDSEDFQKSLKG